MKILIIGHSVEDYIHRGKDTLLQPGGIYYAVAALNAIKEKIDEIFLCTAIEKENYNLFAPAYGKINHAYIQTVKEIPKVHLMIDDNNERGECYQNISENLNLDFKDINSFDGILINMITGYDISLNQLKKIRGEFNGLIYLDVHTFSRGLDKMPGGQPGFQRAFRKIPGFSEWAKLIDIIQVNQTEIKMISDYEDELSAAENTLTNEGQVIIVTKDKLGAQYYKREGDKISTSFMRAIEITENNKVGCGDVFGAVFFYTYIKTKDINKSMLKANIAAGLAASYSKLEDLEKLSGGMALAKE